MPALAGADPVKVDVVVIVDTSNSMGDPGMDPERSSLLVSKLLTDLVPGHLAIVRLLDLKHDGDILPHKQTSTPVPCGEMRGTNCYAAERVGDWEAKVRKNRHGVMERPSRGDADFKKKLDDHLKQKSGASNFTLAFHAAQGVYDRRNGAETSRIPRMVVWLSDGKPDNRPGCKQVINELKVGHVAIETVLFGKGSDKFANEAGLKPRRTSSPREMMKAFAGLFRRMVQAPYELDGEIAKGNSFEMRPYVDEAWVVVYGDSSLSDVTLSGPGGSSHPASYASDMHRKAGAYKVAHFLKPKAGKYAIQVKGGGGGVAFAVVQRSSLSPYLIAPSQALVGAKVKLVAGIRAGTGGEQITRQDLLSAMKVTANVEGKTLTLRDDGKGGDQQAGDGKFTGLVSFSSVGDGKVTLRAKSQMVDRRVLETVKVNGGFDYTGGPITIDLGRLTEGAESCKPLVFDARQQGTLPFELVPLKDPPGAHSLKIKSARGDLTPGGDTVELPPGEALAVCLTTGPRAASSTADGEPYLRLRVAGTTEEKRSVAIHLRWQVDGLTWLERWLWLILIIIGILLLLFIIMGYVTPARFPRSLAVGLAQSHEDLEDVSAAPIKQWRGVGIGFYRNARAFFLPSFRITGKPRGGIAKLHMTKKGLWVEPAGGSSLYREDMDGDWEDVPQGGRRARGGDVFRVGQDSFYFTISMSGGRR